MEQRILLPSIETMDFINEKDGPLAKRHKAFLRRLNLATQVRDGATNGRNFHELGFCCFRNNMRKRSFARAGWPI